MKEEKNLMHWAKAQLVVSHVFVTMGVIVVVVMVACMPMNGVLQGVAVAGVGAEAQR